MKKIILLLVIAYSQYLLAQDLNSFKINQVLYYGERVLQLSSDKTNETGTIQIMNSKQLVVKETSNIELSKSPFYTTISINELPSGNYTVKIITKSKTSLIPFSITK